MLQAADDPQELKSALAYYQRRMQQLQAEVCRLKRDKIISTFDMDAQDESARLALLPNLDRPRLDNQIDFECSKGFRLMDLQTLRIALNKADACGCAKPGNTLIHILTIKLKGLIEEF